jgi:hypothetical protein
LHIEQSPDRNPNRLARRTTFSIKDQLIEDRLIRSSSNIVLGRAIVNEHDEETGGGKETTPAGSYPTLPPKYILPLIVK